MKETDVIQRLGRDRRTGLLFVEWRDAAGRRRRRSLGTADVGLARRLAARPACACGSAGRR